MSKATDRLKATVGNNMMASVQRADLKPAAATPAQPAIAPTSDRYGQFKREKRAYSIPVDLLIPDPDQPRKEFDEDALERLAESLRTRGQLQPVNVRWDEGRERWVLLTGERRWRASKLAGLTHLTAMVVEGERTADEILTDQLTENCLREDLSPIEQAKAYRALMESLGLSQSEVAEYLHVAKSDVTKSLSLLKLPEDVQESIDAGEISQATGYELTKVKEPDQQARLAKLAKGGLVTSTEVNRVASKRPKPVRYPINVQAGEVVIVLNKAKATDEDLLKALRQAVDLVELRMASVGTGQEAA